jgi:hypothetical protein
MTTEIPTEAPRCWSTLTIGQGVHRCQFPEGHEGLHRGADDSLWWRDTEAPPTTVREFGETNP